MFSILHRKKKSRKMRILGCRGNLKVRHPWNYISPCVCGEKQPCMMINENSKWIPIHPLYIADEIFVMCPRCGKRTDRKLIGDAIKEWESLQG